MSHTWTPFRLMCRMITARCVQWAALLVVLTLSSSALAQERVRIGLADIEYRAPDSSQNKLYGAFGSGVREDTRAFVDMLTTALVKTDKFDVIERDRMEAILQEQGMGQFGLTDGYDQLHLTGLDYVVIGAITEYGMTTQQAQFGDFATARTRANMAVDIRVVDAENGTTAIAESVSVFEDGSSGISMDSVAMRGGQSEAHLLGNVMRRAARDVTFLIVSSVYPIRVATLPAAGDVILNYGDGLLKDGDRLEVFSEGDSVIDPTSGEVLGSEEKLVARIEVSGATSRFSKARIVQEHSPVDVGMIARLVTAGPDTQQRRKRGRKLRRDEMEPFLN